MKRVSQLLHFVPALNCYSYKQNKPNGQFALHENDLGYFINQLSLDEIPGIGKKTFQKLNRYGLYHCMDVRQYSKEQLRFWFGRLGEQLYDKAHGIDERPVNLQRERKSVSVETTFPNDVYCRRQLEKNFNQLISQLNQRVEQHQKNMNFMIQSLVVKIKFSDFSQTTVEQQSAAISSSLASALLEEGMRRYKGLAIRLIGIGIKIQPKTSQNIPVQLSIPFHD